MNNERLPVVTPIAIGTRVSSTVVVLPGIYFRKHSRIKRVWFADTTGIVKSTTNYITAILQDLSSVSYAKVATSDSAAVANTQLAMPLTTPVGDTTNDPEADVPAGTMLNLSIAGIGTAVLTNSVCLVEWYPL